MIAPEPLINFERQEWEMGGGNSNISHSRYVGKYDRKQAWKGKMHNHAHTSTHT